MQSLNVYKFFFYFFSFSFAFQSFILPVTMNILSSSSAFFERIFTLFELK